MAALLDLDGNEVDEAALSAAKSRYVERLAVLPRPIVSLAQLMSLAAEAPAKPAAPPAAAGKFDLESWIERHGLEVARTGPWNGGHKWVLRVCPFNTEHTNLSAVIIRFPSGAVCFKCHHDGCAGKGWHELRDLFEPGWRDRRTPSSTPPPPPPRAAAAEPVCEVLELVAVNLATVKVKPVIYQVPNRIPLGKLVLVAGDGGQGKSVLTLDLTGSLTTGRCAFGLTYPPLAPQNVLLISCEDDSADTIVPRLLAAGADLSRVEHVTGTRDAKGKVLPFSIVYLEPLKKKLESNRDIKTVIVDPTGAFVGRTGKNDHRDSELRAVLQPLADVAMEYRITIILVMHINKGTTSKAVHKVMGSAAYVNAVRAAHMVAEDPEDADRRLFMPIKRNLSPKDTPSLAFTMEGLPPDEKAKIIAEHAEHLEPAEKLLLESQLFRIKWLGEASVDPDAVMSAGSSSGKTLEEAAAWLKDFLGEHAYHSEAIIKAAKTKRFSRNIMFDAKDKLGIKAAKIGPIWFWGLGPKADWKLKVPDSSDT